MIGHLVVNYIYAKIDRKLDYISRFCLNTVWFLFDSLQGLESDLNDLFEVCLPTDHEFVVGSVHGNRRLNITRYPRGFKSRVKILRKVPSYGILDSEKFKFKIGTKIVISNVILTDPRDSKSSP